MIPVNGKQINYRIGTTDRPIGKETITSEGFLVLNTATGKVFRSEGGVWVDGGVFPPDLLNAWYGTVEGIDGFRIGTTDRTIGEATTTPEGFLVYNTTNGKTFVVQNGVWTDGGTFPADLMTAWLGA
jgi:hypothetical protein